MQFDVITLFPEMLAGYCEASILGRAGAAGLISVRLHQLRDYAVGKHRVTDEPPYGGGGGMVLKPEPLFAAVEAVRGDDAAAPVILLTPQGRPFTQAVAAELSQRPRLILVAGPVYTHELARPGGAATLKDILDLYPIIPDDIRLHLFDLNLATPRRLTFSDSAARLDFLKLDDRETSFEAGWDRFFTDMVGEGANRKPSPMAKAACGKASSRGRRCCRRSHQSPG